MCMFFHKCSIVCYGRNFNHKKVICQIPEKPFDIWRNMLENVDMSCYNILRFGESVRRQRWENG